MGDRFLHSVSDEDVESVVWGLWLEVLMPVK